MSFDFSKFATPREDIVKEEVHPIVKEELSINREILVDNSKTKQTVKVNEIVKDNTKEQETDNEKLAKMSFDEMIDYLVEKYKDSPKILLSTELIFCEYDDKSCTMHITNKTRNKTVIISNAKELFEEVAFKIAKRSDKQVRLLTEFESRFKEEVIDNESKS